MGDRSFLVSHMDAGPQRLQPSSTAFPGNPAESWIRNRAARKRTSTHKGCQHPRQRPSSLYPAPAPSVRTLKWADENEVSQQLLSSKTSPPLKNNQVPTTAPYSNGTWHNTGPKCAAAGRGSRERDLRYHTLTNHFLKDSKLSPDL